MKRSMINALIRDAQVFLEQMRFKLPPWGYWLLEDWNAKKSKVQEIVDNLLGWDLTDFGLGDFRRMGLVLFTLRNGNVGMPVYRKCYAEKIMIVDVNQETPLHFHWNKMEDIINRGGGTLVIELYRSDEDEQLSREPLTVKIDGIEKTLEAGCLATIRLEPGESICLEPYLYHRFFAQGGKVLAGEVSSVNDDRADNRFYVPVGRFPEIEEDEEPSCLLVNDYSKYL